ncbi:bifunctional diguanylate cyclase/phosphodiesterase [Aquabacterium sp. CECT 9606]|uniref:putative bifunctional diguanylate cyclase/phosphodiesterase n=1 Tax=Aquabacterium sp. CECT 9606 TaxID=2845822 RepID=UPI001E458E22|nr:bifunctional diguanylate cyclase/phosphodiesterase [Aquabacterium sp. CECT 9606]CAH0350930.1 putative signaling protein [Aquabacterium sp. CECT 9606]
MRRIDRWIARAKALWASPAVVPLALPPAPVNLRDLSHHDPLTGLANRLLFEDRLDGAARRAEASNRRLGVLFIDLDGFKAVNESYGHKAGDELLREVGRRVALQARQSDTVARLGSDQFLMLLDSHPDASAAAVVAARLRASLAEVIQVEGRELRLSCSVGIVLYPEHGPRAKLIAHADAAMSVAKQAGGGMHVFFEPHMAVNSEAQIDLQRDLRHALDLGGEGLSLDYQPKVDTKSGRLTGVEALLRWRHPQQGPVEPNVFIPVAERFGLIGALGQWVIDEACRQQRAWQDEGLDLRVAINLSVHQVRQADLVERIEHALKAQRIQADRLMFEVSEIAAMADPQACVRLFEQFMRLGVQVSIDDFGMGNANLSQLRKLPACQLKIDRSFVQSLEHDVDAQAIVDAAVRLSHALGLNVVAEGVETAHQQDILLRFGCDELQGYLFARPMSPVQMALWARSSEAVPRPAPPMRLERPD